MWPDTRLCDLLDIEHPIIQAPMLGTTTPAMVAAVSNAGGLGSHGCTSQPLDRLEAEILAMTQQTSKPFNLNFFCHDEHPMDDQAHTALTRELAQEYADTGAKPPSQTPADPAFAPFDAERLALVLKHPPAVISFHFGMPDAETVAALKAAGCRILCSATTVAEARWIEERGADAIIAQGWEAGGHRGVFLDVERDAQVGLFALLPQVADAVSVPVIAAGGVSDGRGIAAAFALGASGVQIGTAFVTVPEAAQRELHMTAVAAGRDDSTLISTAVSGRPARAHRTAWLQRMTTVDAAPFPLQYQYSRPLQDADPEKFQFSLYGQAASLSPEGGAAERLHKLVDGARDAFASFGGPG